MNIINNSGHAWLGANRSDWSEDFADFWARVSHLPPPASPLALFLARNSFLQTKGQAKLPTACSRLPNLPRAPRHPSDGPRRVRLQLLRIRRDHLRGAHHAYGVQKHAHVRFGFVFSMLKCLLSLSHILLRARKLAIEKMEWVTRNANLLLLSAKYLGSSTWRRISLATKRSKNQSYPMAMMRARCTSLRSIRLGVAERGMKNAAMARNGVFPVG